MRTLKRCKRFRENNSIDQNRKKNNLKIHLKIQDYKMENSRNILQK